MFEEPAADFASRVVQWQKKHGRHEFPWQRDRDPYRVWLSEIMLQQTQVSTVLAYYQRFLTRFPDVARLADAPLDDVLAMWSGLGYYSRARNLHACAQVIKNNLGGQFPGTAAALQELPGIGRSTAAAIASFCFGERCAILDGNVKRVLTRFLAFDSDLSVAANERALWTLAESLLPRQALDDNMPRYTQGLMDIGAMVCLSRQPACTACPLASRCLAQLGDNPLAYPVRRRKLKRGSEPLWLLWAQDRAGAVWLERRPTPGVWAGLFCLPVFSSRQSLEDSLPDRHRAGLCSLPVVVHALTHKVLHLHPLRVNMPVGSISGADGGAWFPSESWAKLGLPAPVRKLLAKNKASRGSVASAT